MKMLFAKAGIKTLKEWLKIPQHKWRQHIKGLTHGQWRKIIRFVLWHDLIDYLKV